MDLDTSHSHSPKVPVKTKSSYSCNPNWRSDYFTLHKDSNQPYKCNDCIKAFVTKASMKKHFFAKHCQGYQCPKCLVCFAEKKILTKHQSILCKSNQKNVEFNMHPKWRPDFYTFNKDMKQPYQCRDCDKHFLWIKCIRIHFYAVHCQGYQCQNCEKCFTSNTLLKKHQPESCTELIETLSEDQSLNIEKKTTMSRKNALLGLQLKKEKCSNPNMPTVNKETTLNKRKQFKGDKKPNMEPKPGKWNLNLDKKSIASGFKPPGRTKVSYSRHPNWRSDYFTLQKDSDRPYKCNDCVKNFVTQTSVQRHFYATHCQGFQCPKCLVCFSEKKSLTIHQPSLCTGTKQLSLDSGEKSDKIKRNHPNWRSDFYTIDKDREQPYQCDDCDKRFHHKEYITQHFYAIHCKGYQCPKCQFCFASNQSLRKHEPELCTGTNREKSNKIKIYHPNWRSDFYTINKDSKQPYKCDDCDKSFSSKEFITKHFYAIHCQGYQCPKCLLCLSSNQKLRRHRPELCTGTKKNNIKQRKNISAQKKLIVVTSNLEERPEISVSANAPKVIQRTRKTYFQNHPKWRSDFYTKSKNKSKPYQCTECYKKFLTHKIVRNHFYAIHCQGYQCQKCDKCFSNITLLEKHQSGLCTGRKSEENVNKTIEQNVNQPIYSDFVGYQLKQEIVEIEDESELPYLTKIHTTTGLEENTFTDVESMFQSSNPKLLDWNPDSDLTCMPCGKIFPHVNDLNKHLNQYQDGNCHKEKQTCPVCNYILDNIYLLQAHLEQIHHGKVISPEKEI